MKSAISCFAIISAVCGSAAAQSSVSIYGIIDIALVREIGGPKGNLTKLTGGTSYGNRLGFRSTEDLGGGLSAFAIMEMGFLDDGQSAQGGVLFGRQTVVGLKGDYGQISFGRQYTPINYAMGPTDPFILGTAGRESNVFASTYVSRANNSVYYKSPTVSGLSGDVIYGFGEVANNSSASRYVGASGTYTNGPLFGVLAYSNANNATATGAAKITLLGSTYDLGPAKVHFSLAASRTTQAGVSIFDNNDVMVGVSVPVGAHKVMASYIKKNDHLKANQDARQVAIGYTYTLSKRTNFYASGAFIRNSNGGTYQVGNATESGSGNPRGYNLGIRHVF